MCVYFSVFCYKFLKLKWRRIKQFKKGNFFWYFGYLFAWNMWGLLQQESVRKNHPTFWFSMKNWQWGHGVRPLGNNYCSGNIILRKGVKNPKLAATVTPPKFQDECMDPSLNEAKIRGNPPLKMMV